MKYPTLCAVLFACLVGLKTPARLVAADTADSIGVQCKMRRECVQLASKEGQTTLALEMRVGRYGVTERNTEWVRSNYTRIQQNCAQMSPSERYTHAECVVIEEFEARRTGDLTAHGMLYEEGYNRNKSRSRIKATPQRLRETLSPFDRLLFRLRFEWDSYVVVDYGMSGPKRKGFPFAMHLKNVGGRYWISEESGMANLSSISYQFSASYARSDAEARVLPEPPTDVVRLKLSLDQNSPIENRQLSIETLQGDVAADSTAVVLYIRVISEDVTVPLLQADRTLLDPPSASLRSSLAKYNDTAATIDELVDLWVPEARRNVEANLRHLQDADHPLNARFFGQEIDKVRSIARVETEDGIVWYMRYPKIEVGPQGVTRVDGYRTLIQREIDGKYKLAQRLKYPAVSDILTNSEVVSFISRMVGLDP